VRGVCGTFETNRAQKKSPVRAVRETRSRKCSPSKGSASARAIGKKLLKRTADKPDALMAETPAQAQDSPMVARRSTKNKKVVLPRFLSVWRPGQPVPGQPVVRGTEVMASISRERSQKNLRASDKKTSDKKPTKRGKWTMGAKLGANKKSQTAKSESESKNGGRSHCRVLLDRSCMVNINVIAKTRCHTKSCYKRTGEPKV